MAVVCADDCGHWRRYWGCRTAAGRLCCQQPSSCTAASCNCKRSDDLSPKHRLTSPASLLHRYLGMAVHVLDHRSPIDPGGSFWGGAPQAWGVSGCLDLLICSCAAAWSPLHFQSHPQQTPMWESALQETCVLNESLFHQNPSDYAPGNSKCCVIASHCSNMI